MTDPDDPEGMGTIFWLALSFLFAFGVLAYCVRARQ